MGPKADPGQSSSTGGDAALGCSAQSQAAGCRLRLWLKYWAPVVLWMALIFSASTDVGSSDRSSRLIAPVLRWLFPSLPEPTIDAVVLGVRKTAHMTEYAVLTVLVWRALRRPVRSDPRPWSWRPAGLAVAVAMAYAVSDELHQAFVPSRQAQLTDVLLDSVGALLGLAALATWTRCQALRTAQLGHFSPNGSTAPVSRPPRSG